MPILNVVKFTNITMETIGDRLKRFCQKFFKTQTNLADYLQIDRTQLNKYMSGNKLPGKDILIKLIDANLSIDWLLRGEGSMYYKHRIEESKSETNAMMNTLALRIKSWINKNYLNVENICYVLSIDPEEFESFLEEEEILDTDFVSLMRQAGCSIRWLYSGEGDEYDIDYVGDLVRANKMKNQNGNIKKIDQKFLDFLKDTIAEEQKNKGEDDE